MKFSRETVEQIFEKTNEVKPSFGYKMKMNFRIMRAINQNKLSYFSGYRILVPHAVSVLSVFLVLMTSSITTLYAYNNPYITTGNPLYALKTGAESVEKMLTFSPEGKAEVFSKLANRRAEEAMIIAESTGSINADVIQEVKLNNSQAITHAKTISKEQNKAKTKDNLVTSSNQQKENLNKVKDIALNKAKDDQNVKKDVLSLEAKSAIFLSAPVSMDNISVRDQMIISANNKGNFGLVDENDETLVISGFMPEDDDILTEDEIMGDSEDIKLVNTTLEEVEYIADKDKLDTLLEDETMFIN